MLKYGREIALLVLTTFVFGILAPTFTPWHHSSAVAEEAKPKPVKTVSSKLYLISKLMADQQRNWEVISELLREILERNDLNNNFVRSRLVRVKGFVDREWMRKLGQKILRGRNETLSFLEARILIHECIIELRPHLNRSWDGEVRYFKNLALTAIFPNADEDGVIEFPDPKSYTFSFYAYTLENIHRLMTAPGGKDLRPAFKEFLLLTKKRTWGPWDSYSWSSSYSQQDDEEPEIDLQIRALSTAQDILHTRLINDGTDPTARILPGEWGEDDSSSPWRGGGWGDSASWYGNDAMFQYAWYRAYIFVKSTLDTLRHKRSIDIYEPYTLLMTALSNPTLIDYDDQLRDFMSGVRFKYRVAVLDDDSKPPSNWDERIPRDAASIFLNGGGSPSAPAPLIQLLEQAFSPDQPVRLEVNNERGKRVLYVVTQLNGNSNLTNSLLTFRNAITVIQGLKHMPQSVVWTAALTPQKIEELVQKINQALGGMGSDNVLLRRVGQSGQILWQLVFVLGSKGVTKVAEKVGTLLQWLLNQQKFKDGVALLNSEGFLRALVGISLSLDIIEAGVLLDQAELSSERREVLFRTSGKMLSTSAYLIHWKPAILALAGFDVTHMIWDAWPSSSEVFESATRYSYGVAHKTITGKTIREDELGEMKAQLQIVDSTEAATLLAGFQAGIVAAKSKDDLDNAHRKFSQELARFAAKRLVFLYASVSQNPWSGNFDTGAEIESQSNEYDRIYWAWFVPPNSPDGLKEQMGLGSLRKLFEKRWAELHGAPRKRVPYEDPTPSTPSPDPDNGGGSTRGGGKKDPSDPDLPWEDLTRP